jgi:tetratricopeptide (TPR) repeat protein
MFRIITCILIACCLNTLLLAQPKNFTQIEDADEHFDNGNFLFAIPAYQNELKKTPENIKVKYKLGICYLNTRISREDAVTYLEEASKSPKIDQEVWFFLGRAYHLNNRIEEALSAYDKFIGLKPKDAGEALRLKEQCENAKKFMQKPTDVTVQNLGKHINSEEPDYTPFIDREEMFLVFTSRRKDNIGGKKVEIDGYRSSDVYQCVMENGNWSAAKNAGRGLNTNLDEQVVGLRSDGLEMYLYIDHIDKFGDIYVSGRRDETSEFAKAKKLDDVVNEKIETSGCISEDGNYMFFARRQSMQDNSDLYLSRKLPNGKWGVPVRLPENINTPYNEDFPFLSIDGETLYFASGGHNSMGGLDLFKTSWNKKSDSFSPPVNLGFPINSTDDDKSICVTRDNRLAYISSFRPNGFGDLDLYRVKFSSEPVIAIYVGKVFMGDTVQSHQPKTFAVNIIVTDKVSGYEYTFVPHTKTGRFVIALPAGEYELTTQSKGFQKHKENLTVTDMGRKNLERRKDLFLKKNPKK